MPAKGITAIHWVDDLGDTPAKVNRDTGEMWLSIKYMSVMTQPQRLYIMLHEMAHVVLQTTDEVKADAWAFEQYAKMGYSLKAGVKALTRVLSDSNPEHAWRMYLQLRRAQEYDYRVNKNLKVYQNE